MNGWILSDIMTKDTLMSRKIGFRNPVYIGRFRAWEWKKYGQAFFDIW